MTTNAVSYPIPLGHGADLMIIGPFPITQSQWDQFVSVLNAMKPALIRPDDQSQPSESEPA